MPKPRDYDLRSSVDQHGKLFADFTNPTQVDRKKILADKLKHADHLREMESLHVNAAMKDRSNLNKVLIGVLCVTLVICSVLLLAFNDPLKTQGAFTLMGAILSGWFSYLAGKRAD